MNNLVSSSISYKGLKAVFNGDERKVIDTIKDIKDYSLKNKLQVQASQYWANILKTSPSQIYYGDISDKDLILSLQNGSLQKEYIIGNALFVYRYSLTKLKGVIGKLVCPNITNLPNLEFVTEGIEMGQPCDQKIKKEANLPKLKRCQYIDLSGLKILSLNIKDTSFINLARTDIKDFHIKKAKEIILDNSNIKNISSLEKVDHLSLYSVDCKKLKINSKLIINKQVDFANINGEIMEKYLKKNKIITQYEK